MRWWLRVIERVHVGHGGLKQAASTDMDLMVAPFTPILEIIFEIARIMHIPIHSNRALSQKNSKIFSDSDTPHEPAQYNTI